MERTSERPSLPAADGSDRPLAERQPAGRRGVALITGAAGGIGKHLARWFAAGGFDFVLVARREDRLKDLGDELAQAHGVDLTSCLEATRSGRAIPSLLPVIRPRIKVA